MSNPGARLPLEVFSIILGFAAIDIHEAAGATQVNTQWRLETSRIRWKKVNDHGFPTIQHLGAYPSSEQQFYANLIVEMTFTISVSNNHPNLSHLGFPGLQALNIKQSFLLGHGGTANISNLVQPLLNTLVIEGGTTERFLPALKAANTGNVLRTLALNNNMVDALPTDLTSLIQASPSLQSLSLGQALSPLIDSTVLQEIVQHASLTSLTIAKPLALPDLLASSAVVPLTFNLVTKLKLILDAAAAEWLVPKVTLLENLTLQLSDAGDVLAKLLLALHLRAVTLTYLNPYSLTPDNLGALGNMPQLTTLALRGLTTLNLSNVTKTALLHTFSCMPLLETLELKAIDHRHFNMLPSLVQSSPNLTSISLPGHHALHNLLTGKVLFPELYAIHLSNIIDTNPGQALSGQRARTDALAVAWKAHAPELRRSTMAGVAGGGTVFTNMVIPCYLQTLQQKL
ncbi:hypothetical protein E4T43_04769 [Aureobasidium subglaciale]|nr:hypothetical protein E4T43_04769 [Aureobasidium subglaciale]